MDVTPKAFRDVQFREKLRGGYHPEDVDDFLEQAAVGVEALLDRLQQATERALRAEQAASESNASDETLKRMLLMAQRTVDQAVKESHDEADHLLAEARKQADALLADAEERGRAAYESHVAEGRANVEIATSTLKQAQQESEALRAWVDSNRAHLLGILREAAAVVENAGLLSEPPPVSALDLAPWHAKPAAGAQSSPGNAAGATVTQSGLGPPAGEDQQNWDARYLEEMARQPLPAPPAGPADEEVQAGPGEPEDGMSAVEAVAQEAGPAEDASGDEQTVAFDERALDSFFSEQDLGDERGTGRFRRRQ